jgi:hypothetical protein
MRRASTSRFFNEISRSDESPPASSATRNLSANSKFQSPSKTHLALQLNSGLP